MMIDVIYVFIIGVMLVFILGQRKTIERLRLEIRREKQDKIKSIILTLTASALVAWTMGKKK